ncbi:hypothetical protein [Methylocystis sp. ATCC 49242]|uniref:hypothetical protein n=1 Tax=Methylocystis sp. ATCC 49242 TaxID=622637 RepID=UPI001186D4A3|nr:hypothetical protein [Methylocystis sp. ATCC 49242]
MLKRELQICRDSDPSIGFILASKPGSEATFGQKQPFLGGLDSEKGEDSSPFIHIDQIVVAGILDIDSLLRLRCRSLPRPEINSCMRIAEITSPADQQKIASLDRNAKQAAFRVKQERYRQRLNRYNERIRTKKPGSKTPIRAEPPKPPKY